MQFFDTSNIDGYLLRDSGYPCKKFLLTPYLQRQSRQEIRYNRSHKVTVCLWLRRCKETSVFAVAHILSHFFCISLMSLCTEFPAFTMFAISCHALFLPPEVIDEENFAFKITFLFSCSSNNTTFSLSVQFGFR